MQCKSQIIREISIMKFQAQIWSSLFVVLGLFVFSNARDLGSSSNTTNLVVQDTQNQEPSVLQKHAMFFDFNNDGLVYPSETFEGFRAIGAGIGLSTAAAALINQAFSSKTRPGLPFDPNFPIVVKNINLAKHTSDSGVYDTNGGFVEAKFEEIFQKHAKTYPNALTSDELNEFVKSNRKPKDYKRWVFALAEWTFLFQFGKDDKGLLQKETIRACFDGSLFEQLAKKNAA